MPFSKRTITWFLIADLVVIWSAVALRIDRFPLTWAPMYSVYEHRERTGYNVQLKDRRRIERKGWRATHLDGRSSWVPREAINVPSRSMWRLYYNRTWGKPPPKYTHLNHDAGTFDRRLWGLEPGRPYVRVNWKRRLLESVNRTLDHAPGDPDFVVALEARSEMLEFDGETFDLRDRHTRRSTIHWKESWSEDFR